MGRRPASWCRRSRCFRNGRCLILRGVRTACDSTRFPGGNRRFLQRPWMAYAGVGRRDWPAVIALWRALEIASELLHAVSGNAGHHLVIHGLPGIFAGAAGLLPRRSDRSHTRRLGSYTSQTREDDRPGRCERRPRVAADAIRAKPSRSRPGPDAPRLQRFNLLTSFWKTAGGGPSIDSNANGRAQSCSAILPFAAVRSWCKPRPTRQTPIFQRCAPLHSA